MKICRKCQKDLTPSNSSVSQVAASNFVCKTCYNEYQKQYREANADKFKGYNAKLSQRFARFLESAKRRGIEVSISFDDFSMICNEACVYCQNKLCGPSVQGSNLDRIDNMKHYSIDNVQPCCKICNNIRNQFLTVEETHAAVKAVLTCRGY